MLPHLVPCDLLTQIKTNFEFVPTPFFRRELRVGFFLSFGGAMARINIEEGFWTDIGIVTAAMGDELRAIGAVIKFWRLAQQAHKKGKYISEADFKMHGFVEAMIPVFAERKAQGIQARGAEKHFGWLKKKKYAGTLGGKASQAKRSKSKHSEAFPEHSEPSPSSSLSTSESLSFSEEELNTNTQGGPKDPPRGTGKKKSPPPSAEEIELRKISWESYTKAFTDRWKDPPTRNATTNSQMVQFVKRVGRDAPDVLEFYVKHNDSQYVKKLHPVGLALQDAEGLRTQWRTNTAVTATKVRQFEKTQFHGEQMERIDKGML